VPVITVIADDSFGSGSVPGDTIPGTGEPTGTGVAGRLLISVVAIQGSGASSATISLPTAPGPWVSIGDWFCNGGSGNEVHVAAAYRITDQSDSPDTQFTWTFSGTFDASVVNTVYSGISTSDPIDTVQQNPTCNPGNAGSLIVAPAITTTIANDLLVDVFAAAGAKNSSTLTVGSPLGPIVDQDNSSLGPADFNAYAITTNLSPGEGSPGSYGPYAAIQGASGESLAVQISVQP